MELNILYVKKLNMNKAEIVFDSIERALAWERLLNDQHVQHVKIVWHMDGMTYFGFKMSRCRYQMPKLILESNKEDRKSVV